MLFSVRRDFHRGELSDSLPDVRNPVDWQYNTQSFEFRQYGLESSCLSLPLVRARRKCFLLLDFHCERLFIEGRPITPILDTNGPKELRSNIACFLTRDFEREERFEFLVRFVRFVDDEEVELSESFRVFFTGKIHCEVSGDESAAPSVKYSTVILTIWADSQLLFFWCKRTRNARVARAFIASWLPPVTKFKRLTRVISGTTEIEESDWIEVLFKLVLQSFSAG